ncbi:Zinc finger, C3HC4 type (RING finger), partial [Rhizoctonia solani]
MDSSVVYAGTCTLPLGMNGTMLTQPRQPFVDPTTATPCGHTFCRTCITQAIHVAAQCPIDRGALVQSDIVPAPQLVRNMVDELVVQCPNAPLGCTHTSQRYLISAHACTYTPVACACPECPNSVLEHDQDAHTPNTDTCTRKLARCSECGLLAPAVPEHPDRCPARPHPCSYCQTTVPHNRLAAHAAADCPAAPVPCPLSVYGCTHTGPTKDIPTHLSEECPFEKLKPFLAITQSRIASLEHTVSELKLQLDATKNSLGPWFRPAGAPPSTEPEPPRFEFRPLVGRRRVSSPLHTSMFHFDDSDGALSGTAAANAGNRRRAGSGSSALRQAISGSTEPDPAPTPDLTLDPFSHILPPSPTNSSARIEAVPYIPPLNTNSSLEHTLSTLRNGLVSLAASLDMAERRQEVAVTTESLRMHEEVGSMRAIVHGLRMQVSALVMERNVAMMGRMRTSTAGSSTTTTERASSNTPERNEGERWATETRYYNQHPPPPVNLAVPYSIRRQETNNKL